MGGRGLDEIGKRQFKVKDLVTEMRKESRFIHHFMEGEREAIWGSGVVRGVITERPRDTGD